MVTVRVSASTIVGSQHPGWRSVRSIDRTAKASLARRRERRKCVSDFSYRVVTRA
jgi:hypothetical protein